MCPVLVASRRLQPTVGKYVKSMPFHLSCINSSCTVCQERSRGETAQKRKSGLVKQANPVLRAVKSFIILGQSCGISNLHDGMHYFATGSANGADSLDEMTCTL